MLYCVTVCVLILGVECVMVRNVVLMAGTVRQCIVAGLMPYCVTSCILLFGFECVLSSNVVFVEGIDREIGLW